MGGQHFSPSDTLGLFLSIADKYKPKVRIHRDTHNFKKMDAKEGFLSLKPSLKNLSSKISYIQHFFKPSPTLADLRYTKYRCTETGLVSLVYLKPFDFESLDKNPLFLVERSMIKG